MTAAASRTFPLLADPAGYRACLTDLLLDAQARDYWVALFDQHFDVLLAAAAETGASPTQCANARAGMQEMLNQIRSDAGCYGRLDILRLDELRGRILRAAGIHDEFRLVKDRENAAAMHLLRDHLRRIDADGDDRLTTIVTGMLAGNLFDMGVQVTAEAYTDGTISFDDAMARVPDRPWLVDDLDQVAASWRDRPARRAMIFVDNAGADFVLGVLPLARFMRQSGTHVILAANEHPALNDVTVHDAQALCVEAAGIDAAFSDPAIEIVSTGNDAPLIDLASVSASLHDAARDVDLIVLVGMGRAVESNWQARFTCPVWRVAMIKDPQVARSVNGAMFDAVFRLD